jgi:hypothetical protein
LIWLGELIKIILLKRRLFWDVLDDIKQKVISWCHIFTISWSDQIKIGESEFFITFRYDWLKACTEKDFAKFE